jgi:peptide/nickel transport system permease protein
MTAAIEPAPALAALQPGRLRLLWSNPNGVVGLAIIIVLLVIAVLAALGITPHPPLAQEADIRFFPPSAENWLGTDQFGRDVASRVMVGVFASLRVAVLAVAIAAAIGSVAGIASGYFGGWTDRVVGRITDMLFAFPAILLALAVLAALGRGRGRHEPPAPGHQRPGLAHH